MSCRGAVLLLAACLSAPLVAAQAAPPVAGENGVPIPKRSRFVAPEYPPQAQANGIRGIVILELTIDTQGHVSEVDVIRSIPGLDEAAIAAARRWEYEPLRVDGRPLAVRHRVPITFMLKLPELTRQDGVPELRQGAAPAWPAGAPSKGSARVAAELFVDATGQVVSAEITSGEQPWSDALISALRTWAFVPDASGRPFALTVKADFSPAERSGQPRVALQLGALRKDVALPADVRTAPGRDAEPKAAPPEQPPAPASAPPATPPPPKAEAPKALPAPAPGAVASPSPEAPAATTAEPAARPSPAATLEAGPASAPTRAGATPPAEAAAASPPPALGPAQPAAEVLRGPVASPTPPPAPGVSAVRDVQLAIGVPDLVKGRRPVAPPLARMTGAEGTVLVRFAIDGAGATSIAAVEGPEALQPAARSVVESWSFRRTSIERLRAVAEIGYRGDGARASVRLEP